MINDQIDILKSKLNTLIDEGCSFEKVYELSVELDNLILEYYKEKEAGRNP